MRSLFGWISRRISAAEGTIEHGVGKGLRFHASGANAGYRLGTSEPGVQQALQTLISPGMSVYDVGANVGFFTVISARLVGPEGRVIAFEPLPGNVDSLRANLIRNGFSRAEVISVALGDRDAEVVFQVSANPTWGKIGGLECPGEKVGEMQVCMRCLDSLGPELELPPPGVVKIDVEGAEDLVLAGAKETLIRWRPRLIVELHGTNELIDGRLEASGYHRRILGGSDALLQAPPDAIVLAAQREDREGVELVNELSRPHLPRR